MNGGSGVAFAPVSKVSGLANAEVQFLQRINDHLPEGVDWKRGAVTYLRDIVKEQGAHAERYHLVKPFVGGPDFDPFFVDIYSFLNVVQALQLEMRSTIIDVGCGPGWTTLYLAKLGHRVVGLDISAELLDVARQRAASDPFPPFPDAPLAFDLVEHDIEDRPLGLDEPADCALLESTLHHFYNPVAALRNIAADLKPDGVIAVVEGAAPPPDSVYHQANVDLMVKYHTIERPYSADDLVEMLQLSGFTYYEYFYPVNGLHRRTPAVADSVRERIVSAGEINVIFASRTQEGLRRVAPDGPSRTQAGYVSGFFPEEQDPGGKPFRWAGPRAVIRAEDGGDLRLTLGTHFSGTCLFQDVVVRVPGRDPRRVRLDRLRSRQDVVLEDTKKGQLIELTSGRVFSPSWQGGDDLRLLSFTVGCR